MVVQHNLQASNANRMLNITTGQQAKSTEKLSSGYKINRAADDAAGLSISEKMRKQIKGLDRASTNAEDGVSAVQTAEGALTEVHSMLQRMNELAVQAANGTNSESDRESIQNEIAQLTTEIDRVSETTKFNETYLLKGSAGTRTLTLKGHDAGLNGVFSDSVSQAKMVMTLNVGSTVSIGGRTYNIVSLATGDNAKDTLSKVQKMITGLANADNLNKKVTLDGTSYTISKVTVGNTSSYQFVTGTGTVYNKGQLAAKISDGTKVQTWNSDGTVKTTIARDKTLSTNITIGKAVSLIQTALTQANNIGVGDKNAIGVGYGKNAKVTFVAGGGTANQVSSNNVTTGAQMATVTFTVTKGTISVQNDLNFALHVGADADMTNKIGVKVEAMNSYNLGVHGINVKDDSGIAATYAIDSIEEAINKVSAQRSALGAVQNRLEHTIANLDNVVENTESAESRIRDTDMAEEMVTYSKNNILAQAGQSMLAQANQSNQGVLSLIG